jgi:hypothetical protein
VVEDIGILDVLREKAERCRRLARQTTNYEVARRLSELGDELEERARELEGSLYI